LLEAQGLWPQNLQGKHFSSGKWDFPPEK